MSLFVYNAIIADSKREDNKIKEIALAFNDYFSNHFTISIIRLLSEVGYATICF